MKKVLDILEQYVQWIALGLAGLYLLYMAWGYVLTSHVFIAIANEKLTPATIDQYILNNPTHKLEDEMNRTGVPEMTVKPFTQHFVDVINNKNQSSQELSLPWIGNPSPIITPKSWQPNIPPQIVTKLPEPLPAPTPALAKWTRAVVKMPPPADAAPPAGAPAAGAAPALVNTDLDWVTVTSTVRMAPIAEQFKQTQMPVGPSTQFLLVVLQRQEQQPDGSWGTETTVQPLSTDPLPPYPAATAAAAEKIKYANWAVGNEAMVIQPKMFEKVPAALAPPAATEANLAIAGSFAPSACPNTDIWIHDATIKPGNVYRYRIQYILKNPMFFRKNFCNPPELADPIGLVSTPTGWSDPLAVPAHTEFFIARAAPRFATSVRLDVFKWKAGVWHKNTVTQGPGDLIEGVSGIDPGWTLVNIQEDQLRQDTIVTVMDQYGNLIRRSYQADQLSAEYRTRLSGPGATPMSGIP